MYTYCIGKHTGRLSVKRSYPLLLLWHPKQNENGQNPICRNVNTFLSRCSRYHGSKPMDHLPECGTRHHSGKAAIPTHDIDTQKGYRNFVWRYRTLWGIGYWGAQAYWWVVHYRRNNGEIWFTPASDKKNYQCRGHTNKESRNTYLNSQKQDRYVFQEERLWYDPIQPCRLDNNCWSHGKL